MSKNVTSILFSWHLASFWFGLVILLSVWFGNILTVHGNVLLSLLFGLVILIFIWIGTVLTCDLNLTLFGSALLSFWFGYLFGLVRHLS